MASLGLALVVAFAVGACSGPLPTQMVTPSARADTASCPLAGAEIQAALQLWLGQGEVAIDLDDNRTGENQCSYILPDGSLSLNGNGKKVFTGTSYPSLTIHRYRYDSGSVHVLGKSGAERKFGGNTPEAVFQSVSIAVRDSEKSYGTDNGLEFLWSEDGGLVTDGSSRVYVAGPGDYWYSAGLGGMKADYSYASSLIELGQTLFSKGGSGPVVVPKISKTPPSSTEALPTSAPAPDAALPAEVVPGLRDRMAGTWTGAVTGDSSKYSVKATIRESGGVLTADVEYPELKCSATWKEAFASGSAVSVKEKLKSGKCLDNVTVGLTLDGETIAAFFTGSTGEDIRAVLRRE